MTEVEREPEYEFELVTQLETTTDRYEEERRNYWVSRLDLEDWSATKQLQGDADSIAEAIRLRAVKLWNVVDAFDVTQIYQTYSVAREAAKDRFQTLLSEMEARLRENLPRGKVDEILDQLRSTPPSVDPESGEDDPLRLVWERLCIEDAREVISGIRDRVDRILELERLVDDCLGSRCPPERCIRYLALVSRCYVYDFRSECVVLCRSALEQALRAVVTGEQLDRLGKGRYGTDASLKRLISAASDLLPAELHKAAEDVRLRGNKAVHSDPDAASEVRGTLMNTLRIIAAISDR